ncbi:MAG: Wzt carbohydrate-binding domain-containing protein, partial [Deltaproteobacteria bacterium]
SSRSTPTVDGDLLWVLTPHGKLLCLQTASGRRLPGQIHQAALAFAVAAHLEPEILLIDEVLAVGDVQFQKKCIGKIQEVSGGGRSVLFVSHHMPSIQRLCSRSIMLASGHIEIIGDTESVIKSYLGSVIPTESAADLTYLSANRRSGSGVARFTRIELLTSDGRSAQEIRQGEPLVVRLHITAERYVDHVLFGFSFISTDGYEVMGTTAQDSGIPIQLEKGVTVFKCEINPMILSPGRYYVRGAIFRPGEVLDHIDEIIGFDVMNLAWNISSTPINHIVGHVYLPYKWFRE